MGRPNAETINANNLKRDANQRNIIVIIFWK